MRTRAALGLSAALAAGVALAAGASSELRPETLAQGVAHDALFALAFDGAQGLAGGAPGRVLSSADSGKTWTLDPGFPSPLAILGADLRGGRRIAVGQMGMAYTREGQAGWIKAETGTSERLMSVSLTAAGLAVAVGSFGTVILSGDFGRTWRNVAPDWTPYLSEDQRAQGIQPHMSAVQLSDTGIITIAGEFSLMLRSSDEGRTWKVLNRGEAAIFALDLRSDGVGYAVGQDGLILRTSDGGAKWTRLNPPIKANLLGVKSSGGKILISAMHDMLASSDGGASFRRVQSPEVQAGWFSGVAISGGDFMAAGHMGQIIKLNL